MYYDQYWIKLTRLPVTRIYRQAYKRLRCSTKGEDRNGYRMLRLFWWEMVLALFGYAKVKIYWRIMKT